MTTNPPAEARVQGSLRSVDGTGIVRLEGRFDTDVADVWSALTTPDRLAGWLGEVEGDLRPGGEIHGRWFASGWEGTVRVDACEPPRRLLVRTAAAGGAGGVVEIALAPDGQQTVLVLEDRDLPVEHLAAYGAGNQIHVEDLAAYLAGRERCDARARWEELHPDYQEMAARAG